MWVPDIITLYLNVVLIDLALALILFIFWKSHKTYFGYISWMVSLPVFVGTYSLFLFRGIIPDLVSIVIANTTLIVAYILRNDSIWKFFENKGFDRRLNSFLVICSFIFLFYFTYIDNVIIARTLFISVMISICGIIGCIPLIKKKNIENRLLRLCFVALLLGLSVVYGIHAIDWIFSPGSQSLFEPNIILLIFYLYIILMDIFTTGLFIMLNMSRYQSELKISNEKITKSDEELRIQYDKLVKSEEKLRESEEKYRNVVTWANDGIILIQGGAFKYLNPKAVEIIGQNIDELIGQPFIHYIHPREQRKVESLYKKRMEGQQTDSVYETVYLNRNGDAIDVEINAVVIQYEGQPTDLVFIRDIRERKRFQKALDQASKKLNLLNTIIFNEVFNQIIAISNYHALMKKFRTDDQNSSIEVFIEKEEGILNSITNSLKFAQTYQDLGIKSAKWQNIKYAFIMAYSHMDTLKMTHVIKTDDLEVFSDSLIEKVFHILIDNTFKHSQTGTQITLDYHIDPDGVLFLYYADNGIGIPDKMKESIFSSEYRKEKGYGLFFAHEILDITDISIREIGESGKGVRFEIRIPKGTYRFSKLHPASSIT